MRYIHIIRIVYKNSRYCIFYYRRTPAWCDYSAKSVSACKIYVNRTENNEEKKNAKKILSNKEFSSLRK